MKKTLYFLTIASLILVVSCSKTELPVPVSEEPAPQGELKSFTIIPLIAGQNMPIGNVFVFDDEDGISVNAAITAPGWIFNDNHIYIGTEAPGSPAPGQFPYSATMIFPTSLELSIPYEDLGTDCGDFYIAFHADVSQGTATEGAWAIPDEGAMYWYNPAGNQIGWGAYFMYSITCVQLFEVQAVSSPLTTVHGKILYQGFVERNIGDQIIISPAAGSFPPFPVNLGTDNYLFSSDGINHIFLNHANPVGLFTTNLETTYNFSVLTFTAPFAVTDAIQIMVKKDGDDENHNVILNNVYINGSLVNFTFEGGMVENDPLRWNITGSVLDAGGGFTLEAELEIIGEAGTLQSSQVEISFGQP